MTKFGLLGLLAGYYRSWVERVLSRAMDAWLSFPGLLLAGGGLSFIGLGASPRIPSGVPC